MLDTVLPLVSCIMPTFGRPKLVHESVAMFLAQDYPHKELILLNDCPGQEFYGDLPDVRIINHPTRYTSLGQKRNAAIALAQGQWIAVWDDDDVYLPWRLSYCVQQLQQLDIPLYLPHEFWAYWGDQQLHVNQATLDWISHPLLMFRKDLWQAVSGYPPITLHEDRGFYLRILEYLKLDPASWISQPIEPHCRFAIMRGCSPYTHTSIPGGQHPPDLTQGRIEIQPCEIADPHLRHASQQICYARQQQLQFITSTNPLRNPPDSQPQNQPATPLMNLQYLDDLRPTDTSVSYGAPGLHGELGYEGQEVVVNGERYPHALSLHAPSQATFQLNGRYTNFSTSVAINDDVLGSETAADFMVFADEQLLAVATNVRPGDPPCLLQADVRQVHTLTLVVRARRWDCCHSVWLSPCLSSAPSTTPTPPNIVQAETAPPVDHWTLDCIGQARINHQPWPTNPQETVATSAAEPTVEQIPELVIATVGSPGWEDWIDDLLGSICANAQCPQAQLVIFFYGPTARIRQVADKYQARLVPCQNLIRLCAASKSVLYSVATVIRAKRYICLDADMLVMDDLQPIVSAIDSHLPGSILVCREAKCLLDLQAAMSEVYGGSAADIAQLLSGREASAGRCPLVINDGFFAGSYAALQAVDRFIRLMPGAKSWIESGSPWRNQCILNLAVARMDCAVEMHGRFNVQLNYQSLDLTTGLRPRAAGQPVAIVHFCGHGRQRLPQLRGRYRQVRRPLTIGSSSPDHYAQFVRALRTWIGQRGESIMTWSFYGTSDGRDARITDSSHFSLLATLHYLIRSNGCERVLETGTARGVTAACIASAIAHRSSPCVISMDPNIDRQREALWGLLPKAIADCIQPRQIDGLVGMAQCLANGERFHAALLDSIHSREQVLQEFALAKQLVCPGGLILIHDPNLHTGTVQQAIDEIDSMGYPVVKLWSAEDGVREDDRLGLAIVENTISESRAARARSVAFEFQPSAGRQNDI